MKKENYFKKSHKELLKIHWQLMSEVVRRTEKGVCYTSGVQKEWKLMDAGHYEHGTTLRNFWLDSDFRNIHCQSTSENVYKSGNLATYAIKLEAQYGIGILQELHALKWKGDKPTPTQIIDRIFELKDMKKKLDAVDAVDAIDKTN